MRTEISYLLQRICLGVFTVGPKSIQGHGPKYSITCIAQVWEPDNIMNNVFKYCSSFQMWHI